MFTFQTAYLTLHGIPPGHFNPRRLCWLDLVGTTWVQKRIMVHNAGYAGFFCLLPPPPNFAFPPTGQFAAFNALMVIGYDNVYDMLFVRLQLK
jgi:hypothetical protein